MNSDEMRSMIWQALASVPRGKVVTYGQLALLAGLPGYARFVGTTLKKLPKNTTLPWFRVINASGRISFPSGSESYLRQRQRLQEDGITVKGDRISLKNYQWQP
ncbi:MAG: MGMT family protein [Motiliproteus sp.]|nr:MGMT family protein [Motiliproteus sp.]MCW9051031.1 MGMT family protein [Motiliproteus sp.]